MSALPPDFIREHPITLKEALSLPALRAGVPEVLAGRESLGRAIRWVHAGEFPEMATVLKGGELLLTTGMGLPYRERPARRWLADLDDCHVAGLVIELGSALATVPEPILAEARERGMPLIALHQQVAFVEITEVVHREILGHRAALLERGEETYRRLSDLMLDGAGAAELVEALADLVGEPVVLARAAGGILFQANRGLRDGDVISLWESTRRGLQDASGALALPVRLGGDPHWAELAVVSTARELGDFDRAALERAAPCVALALMRDREIHALSARARGEFLFTLARGQPEFTERQAMAKAAALGFDHRAESLLPVVVNGRGGGLGHDADSWERLAADARRTMLAAGRPAIAGMQPSADGILMVVGMADERHRASVAEEIADAIHASLAAVGFAGTDIQVSVGRAEPTWRRLRGALREAVAAAAAAPYRRTAPWHDVASPDVAELLVAFRDSAVLNRLVQRLQPLVDHDIRHRSSLLQTLEVLFAHGGRKADAARALHLERQSLYKRLARIQALLGVDLDDEDTRLALHLALRGRAVVQRPDEAPSGLDSG